MDRVIKFRGKRIDNGEWVYGDIELPRNREAAIIHCYLDDGNYDRQHKVEIESVGQFTGIVDKNGKEVYEGDVVDCWSKGKHCKDGIVSWVQNRIFISIKNDKGDVCGIWNLMPDNKGIDDGLSVIGNVFDNSELLKGGENE